MLTVWLVLAQAAQAQQAPTAPPADPTWAVELLPGSRCANDYELVARLNEQIPARQRASLQQAELRAQVSIQKNQSATVTVVDQLSQRQAGQRQIVLEHSSCASAGDALTLVISVMVEAGRSLLPEPVEPPPEPPEPPPEEPKPELAPTPPPPVQHRYVVPKRHAWQGPRPGHDVQLAIGAGLGLLPRFSVGATLGWGIRWQNAWPIWLNATAWLNEPSADLRARVGAGYATVSTCPLVFQNERLRGQLCPGLALGAVWAEGRRIAEKRKDTSPLAMVSLNALGHVKLVGPLELVLIARLEVPVVRLSFVYYRTDGARPELHHTKPVVASFFGGLGLRFR